MSDPIRIGGGRLRVDAARAVAKLREYQLPDPTLWTLEVVRSAVLLGATAIHIEADSDDVWIGFQSEPLADTDLTHLFDDLVSGGGERRAQRLLAIGVNTALALGPRFVDVWSIDDAGARRTRYAPHLLRESSEGTADALRALVAERTPRPEVLLGVTRGGAVHVRRALGMETLSRFVRGDVPPEVHRVLSAATSLRIPIHAQPRPIPAPPPLLSIPLDDQRAARGRVEVIAVERASGPALLSWSELGVVLASDPLVLGPVRDHGRVPIVVRLDFDRLPTNAARSAVRQGEPRIEEALVEAHAIAVEAIAALAQALTEADPTRHPALRAAALAIVHAHLRDDRDWRVQVRELPKAHFLRPLLHVPLLRNALGAQKSLQETAHEGEEVVYRGAAAVRPELAPWMANVPWIPIGDPAYALYGDTPPKDAAELVAHAERRAAARIRYLEKPEVELSFAPRAEDLALATFRANGPLPQPTWLPPDAFGAPMTEGRIAIQQAVDGPRAEIVFLVLRRVIHRITVPSEIPFRAMVTAPTLRANPEYTGLVDEDAMAPIVRALGWAAVRLAELVAASLTEESVASSSAIAVEAGPFLRAASAEVRQATGRAALRMALRLRHEATHDDDALREMVTSEGPLLRAPLFQTWTATSLGLDALQEAAGRGEVVGTIAPRRHALGDPPLSGRLLLSLSDADANALPVLLAPKRASEGKRKKARAKIEVSAPLVVPYGDTLFRPKTSVEDVARRFARPRALLLEETPHARAAFALLGSDQPSQLLLSHAGRPLTAPSTLNDAHLPSGLAVDDDQLVPLPAFDGLANPAQLESPIYDVARWCVRLAGALAAHLLGKTPPNLRLGETDRLALLVAIASLVPDEGATQDLSSLAELAILPRLGGGTQSLFFFRLAGASTLPFVQKDIASRIHRPLEGIEAVAISEAEAIALARFFGVRAVDRTADVAARIAEEDRERAWASFLTRPVVQWPRQPSAVSVSGAGIVEGFAQPAERALSVLRITTQGRLVREHRGPSAAPALEVHVDVERGLVDIDALDLNGTGTSRVKGAIRDATRRLLETLATTQPLSIQSDRAIVDLAQAFVDELPTKRSEPVRRLLDVLLDAPSFPMLGGIGSLRSALHAREGEVWLSYGVDGWLGPAEGAPPNALDEANVLALPEQDRAETLPWVRLSLALIKTIAPSRDVTKNARRLREARRVAASSTNAPTLPPWIDRRFAVTMKALAERASEGAMLLEVFPQGEAALVEEGATRLVLIGERGENVRTYSFVPPVFIVARSPYAAEMGEDEAQARVEHAVRTVVAEILRFTADHVPPSLWSPAIKKAVRGAALLGGATHLDRLASVPIFPTTAGTFVSYEELRAQVNRFGDLWVVTDADLTLAPLDPQRLALRLAEHEAPQLHAVLPTIDGKEELLLDAQARANRSRPRVTSLEPTFSLEGRALGRRRIEVEGGHAWVVPLLPRESTRRATHTFIELGPLGTLEDVCRWPTLSWIDSTALTPNRVHGAPMRDEGLANIEQAVRQASEALVLESLDGGPSGEGLRVTIDADISRSVLGDRGSQVRGLLRWGGVAAPETMTVRLRDGLGDREVNLAATPPTALVPRSVPLVGELLFAGAQTLTLPDTQLDALARRAYVAMLTEAGGRWRSAKASPEEKELALAALVQGAITLHLGALKEKWLSEPLPFLKRGATTLRTLMNSLKDKAPCFALSEAELAVIDQLPENGVVILDDGTLPSRVALSLLHSQSLREWVQASSAPDEPEPRAPDEPEPREPAPTRANSPKAQAPKTKAGPAKGAPTARAEQVLVRRIATLARQIDASLGPVRMEHGRAPMIAFTGATVVLGAEHPVIAAITQTTDAWPAANPILAAELIAMGGAMSELEAVARLLDTLNTE